MKKAFAMLLTAASALVISTFSAAADDISLDTTATAKSDDGVSFSVNSNKIAASFLTESSTVEVGCSGFEGDKAPVKLVLTYWKESEANGNTGEISSAEVEYKEFKDGKAVFAYEDIKKALGDTDLSKVISMDALVSDKNAEIKGFDAKNVLSAKEAADKGVLHTVWVHTDSPLESENWGQSMTIEVDQFDVSVMTPESKAIAFFNSDADEDVKSSPVEFILQSMSDNVSPKAKNGNVWAKVAPVLFSNSYAVFNYEDMVKSYGTDDFTCVTNVHIGDTGKNKIAATDLIVFNCKTLPPVEPEQPAEDSSKEEAVTAAPAVTEAPAETSAPAAAVTSSEADSEKSSTGSNIVFIIIGIVAGVALAVAVLFIILGRKSKETYDISKHRYVKKK